jgi:hypothetical protein
MTINRILALDALSCALTGILALLATNPLSTLLGLPSELLFYGGCILIPSALFMASLAKQAEPWQPGLWLVVAANAAWVLGCIFVLMIEQPGSLGVLFLAVQAIVVAALALAELMAAMRSASGRRAIGR